MNAPWLTTLRKSLGFRLLATLLGLSPFLAAEGLLRFSGWQPPADQRDPYIGIHEQRPLFVARPAIGRYEIPPSRQLLFRPESFAWPKPRNEFRIFCLGGSTVQGRPFAIETAFPTWLELGLQEAEPSRTWEVVNCGGVSYATYRLVPIVREVLDYQPDLLVLYTGHNEFLEDRSYAHLKQRSALLHTLGIHLSRLRLVQFPRHLWRPGGESWTSHQPSTTLATEVDALLDYRGGLADYHRDVAWQRTVIDHFTYNLAKMLQLAAQAGVPVILIDPVSNLRDTPPFKSVVDARLSSRQQTRFRELWSQARALPAGQEKEQQRLLNQALNIDPHHAAAHFLLGHVYERLERYEQAQACYLRAKDEDICPLRMLESMHVVLRHTATRLGIPLVEVRSAWEQQAKHGLVGNDLLLDHVHPSIAGHQQIGRMLVEQIAALEMVHRQPGWKSRQQRRFTAHLAGLDAAYFARGKERLKGLQRWTEGRSNKLKPPASTAPMTGAGAAR